jgi:hypothetical protein
MDQEVSKLWAEKIVSSNPDAPVKSTGLEGLIGVELF